MSPETEQIVKSKSVKEREMAQKLKKMIDDMKFRATSEQVAEFLQLFEAFYQSKGISKNQVVIKKAKIRQSETKSTEK